MKSAAEKSVLCVKVCDSFMTPCMLGVSSGKEFDT